MQTQQAISRLQRDLAVGSMVKWIMVALAAVCLLSPAMNVGFYGTIALISLSLLWLMLSHFSARGTRGVLEAPTLIAQGRFDIAERELESAMRGFSIFRTIKLLALHHLAILRHAQQRWQDSAVLCSALQKHRLGSLGGIAKTSQILLADSLVQLGDLNGAYRAIQGLYRHRLSLAEAVRLLSVQLDYEARVGAWANMVMNLKPKLDLSELMTPREAARAQALLALATKNMKMPQWHSYLRRRVELLGDIQELIHHRPALAELWQA